MAAGPHLIWLVRFMLPSTCSFNEACLLEEGGCWPKHAQHCLLPHPRPGVGNRIGALGVQGRAPQVPRFAQRLRRLMSIL
eukprot:11090994-Alexandrium_andersonii.AAC.1